MKLLQEKHFLLKRLSNQHVQLDTFPQEPIMGEEGTHESTKYVSPFDRLQTFPEKNLLFNHVETRY